MLSEPSLAPSASSASSGPTAVLRRDGLKLSFSRSVSAPHGCHSPVLSPPSVSPSLHPPKRCRMELPSLACAAVDSVAVAAAAHHSFAMPAQPAIHLLRPPPPSIAGCVSLPTSPCSESSTLQRTLLLQKVRTIAADALAARLGATSTSALHAGKSGAVLRNGFLLIDCRPFIAYNVNHIRGAINVNCCDRFNRKRLQQGKASLADLATTKEGKELLKKRGWREVIVYDDCSESLELLPVSHTLFLVMNALMEDHREPVMLLGGLRDFQVANRGLCEDYLMPSAAAAAAASTAPGTTVLLPDLPSPSELCDTKDIENHPATQVLPYLFLGNMRDASDVSVLKRLGIKYVLNVTAKPPDYVLDPDIVYKQLEAADNGIQNLRQFFEEAFDFIDEARTNNSGVLIHCHAGVSRSPTIAVAYLMKHYPMAMAEAYKFIKMRRSIISPNLNFMGQLWEFEQGLRATPSLGAKEPLTVEMQEVADSVRSTPSSSSSSSSSYFFSSDSSGSSACSATASSSVICHSFCWAEPPASVAHHHQHHRRPSKDDIVSSGCSV